MKIGWDNYIKTATLTATSENTAYPLTNLYHNFLLKKYQALTSNVTITIELATDKDVSMIAYDYSNAENATEELIITKGATEELIITKGATEEYIITLLAQYTLKDSSGVTLYTGAINVGTGMNVNYFDAVTCRTIEIEFITSDPVIYVGGLFVGDPIEYEYTMLNPRIMKSPRVKTELTDGGQMISKKLKSLRSWQPILEMDNTKRIETEAMIDSVGYDTPVYADLYDQASIIDPMYCAITNIGNMRRDSKSGLYTMGITLEERR